MSNFDIMLAINRDQLSTVYGLLSSWIELRQNKYVDFITV